MKNYVCPTLLLIFCQIAIAQDHVWIVGGGPNLSNSQAQIELNTQWIQTILHQQRPNASINTYYNDGYNPEKDVTVWQKPDESLDNLQPLARVFGLQYENGEHYRNHQIPAVIGSTTPDILFDDMQRQFEQLKKTDKVLFIYQGHGGHNEDDITQNTLSLWDVSVSAKDFSQLLNHVPKKVPVRFFLPQCYSGGFAQVIYPQETTSTDLASGQRCGFMASSAEYPAEGCSSSINTDDYRDYSTYFFAALNQRTRNNEPLKQNPDRNGDNKISLNEAHYYSLSQAESTDIPRSTSEVYLSHWHPWYLPYVSWFDNNKAPKNIYAQIAKEIALRYNFTATGKALTVKLKQQSENWVNTHENLFEKRGILNNNIAFLQEEIREAIAHKWPSVRYPYTKNFYNFLINDVTEAQQFIIKQPNYAKLVKMQEQDTALEQQMLNLERKITQIDKIQHLRTLARTLDQFKRYATKKEQENYQRLLGCENTLM